jgi:esterase/lipase
MKAIFIVGFTGGKRDIFFARSILKPEYEVIYFKYDTFLRKSVQQISRKLDRFVLDITKNSEKVNLIGVSAGGVIAEYYSRFVNPKKVNKIATICSPLNGTYIPKIFPKKLKGVNQMKYNSPLLKKIKKSRTKTHELNIYSKLDFLVPGNSGKGKNSKHTLFFIHFLIQWWPGIYFKVKRFFEE